MAPNTLDFQCALVTGGGGGLGKAIAADLISKGKKVIIVGRTESTLAETAKAIKATAYYVLDTGKVSTFPAFISTLTSEHPEIDCIVNNAGVQRPLDFSKMSADEFLEKADAEIDINIRGPMHLVLRLLPHLKTKPHACIMNVSSMLGYIPTMVQNPVYNGTKAFVHFHTMNLRTQLAKSKDGGENIRVIEIAPPGVGTDLHREREDPDDNKKDKNPDSLTVEEFMEDVNKGWSEGRDTIGAGPSVAIVDKWFDAFGGPYEKAAEKY